jgi:hypothetical protein
MISFRVHSRDFLLSFIQRWHSAVVDLSEGSAMQKQQLSSMAAWAKETSDRITETKMILLIPR